MTRSLRARTICDELRSKDAFAVYSINGKFSNLEEEATRLVFSEINFDPARVRTAWSIAGEIMRQQVAWTRVSIPRYEAFLARWGTAPEG